MVSLFLVPLSLDRVVPANFISIDAKSWKMFSTFCTSVFGHFYQGLSVNLAPVTPLTCYVFN